MPLAVNIFDQNDFTDADDTRLSVTRRDLVGGIQIDNVLSPRSGVPIEEPISGCRPKIDSLGR